LQRTLNQGFNPSFAVPDQMHKYVSKHIKIGSDLEVDRLRFRALRLTGKGIWGEPKEVDEAERVLKRAVDLAQGAQAAKYSLKK
jgi:hypothetical protein